MKRREFIALAGSAAASVPFAARAQQAGGMRRIGVLFPLAADDPEQKARRDGFQQSLERFGWTDGRNLRIDYRFGGGGADRFAPLAKELVALQPDVIFAQSTGVVAAVQRETRTIPVVFANVSDPVGSGFVASLPRPGGNFTGMMLFDGGLSGKWLAMLKEISPGLRSAVLMIDPKTTPLDYFLRPVEAVAPSLAVEIRSGLVGNAADIERAMEEIGRIPDSGVVIAPGSTMLRNRDLVIAPSAIACPGFIPSVFTPKRVVSYPTVPLTWSNHSARQRLMSIASCAAKSPAICRFRARPDMRPSSTSGQPGRSASTCRRCYLPRPTR